MTLRNPWNSYRQIATQTAAPGQLVLMLFEGAIRFLDRAHSGFGVEDPAEANEAVNNNIQRAQEILHELSMALNLREGGELAATLKGLYEYMDRRLLEANIRKEEDGVVEVRDRLMVLKNAWGEMLRNGGAIAVEEESSSRALAAA